MGFDFMNILSMMKNGNPNEVALQLLRQNKGKNQFIDNALSMAEQGNYKGVEQLARNLCAENNINPEEKAMEIKKLLKM